MRREEDVVAGAAIACGPLVLVPLLRVRVHAFTSWAGTAESEVVGFVSHAADAPVRLIALDDTLAGGDAASAWLAARPALLDAIRKQLATPPRP